MKRYGRLAQLVEHSLDVRRVSGSIPLSSTKNPYLNSCLTAEKVRIRIFYCPKAAFTPQASELNQYASATACCLAFPNGCGIIYMR